jgi:hypothetical protein
MLERAVARAVLFVGTIGRVTLQNGLQQLLSKDHFPLRHGPDFASEWTRGQGQGQRLVNNALERLLWWAHIQTH